MRELIQLISIIIYSFLVRSNKRHCLSIVNAFMKPIEKMRTEF